MAEETAPADKEIFATRLLDAPRELVWAAWTDTAHLEQWWGPVAFTTTTQRGEMKPGGQWRFVMHGPGLHRRSRRCARGKTDQSSARQS